MGAAADVSPPPPSPTLHEVELSATPPPPKPLRAASHDADRPAPALSRSPSLKEKVEHALALPARHDPDHKEPLPVETLANDGEGLTDADLEFPDGGLRAWLVVAGALHMTFATFGCTNSWAVFQSYYQETLPNQSPSSLAWVGSLEYALIFLPAVVLGRLMDIGIFLGPFTAGCIAYVVAFFLTAQTTEFYQIVLAQGILLGISAGVLFGPTLAVVSHWFKRRRSLAFGIVACGSSMGGTVIPILVRKLIPRIGFPWTLRVLGFLMCYCVGFGWCTLRPRLPPKKVKGGMFNLGAFKSAAFSFYVAGCFLIMLGLYTPLSYLDVFGTAAGLGDFSTYLVSIANATSIVGRLVPGYFADKVGPVNLLLPASFLAGIMMFIWPICRTRGPLITFSCIYGMSCGAFVSLFSPGVAQLGETHDIGRRMGMLTTCLSLSALCGPPISGAILTSTGGSYMHVAAFSGSVVFAGVFALFVSRYLVLGGLRGRM